MFYSETLLSKTGPLAKIWLSANLERKLSKSHILQSNIESSVNAIVDQGTAPMALRLSGQLLLGVVRIYSRKARYLLDDCNEALLKIKMAFRPGNVDLPANLSMPSAAALTVADKISDPMMPELDPSLLDFGPMHIDFNISKKDDPFDWSSQLVSDPLSVETGRHEPPRDQRAEFDDDDDMSLELDLDLPSDDGPSVEIGRKAPAPRALEDDMLSENGKLSDEIRNDEVTQSRLSSRVPSLIEDRDEGVPENGPMLFDDDDTLALPLDDGVIAPTAFDDPRLQRDSQSPLSSARSSVARDFDANVRDNVDDGASMRQAGHRVKRRKIIQADAETMLTSAQIKQQQTDRSAILQPASFLSRDPLLLNLLNMQKNGAFVSSIMGSGRVKGWAPELRGILSIEVVRKAGELKRKRDSGVADIGENDDHESLTHLEIPPEDNTPSVANEGVGLRASSIAHEPSAMTDLPADDGLPPRLDDRDGAMAGHGDDEDYSDVVGNNFDDTTAPHLNPMEQGAVSQGTKHAVHLLRDRFSLPDGDAQSQQNRTSLLFQDLLPEATTGKAEATKMFFEVLVLATKDAIKVEQAVKDVGNPLRIRAKRNLWSRWSEDQASGEIADEADLMTVGTAV